MKLRRLFSDFFPRLARGHSDGCYTRCLKAKTTEAKFNDKGEYIDGHYQSQDVAEKAHREGYR